MPSTVTDRLSGLTTSVAVKAPCLVATTAALTLSGEQAVNGVAVVAGDRALVKDQADTTANGIYIVAATAWERAKDFDGSLDAVDGTLVYVSSGSTGGRSFYRLSATNPVIIGISALVWDSVGGTLVDGGVVETSSRANLAALSPGTALLTEAGREGTFTWSSSNHAAHVTSDPGQGVYVAPASDTTGASGAWARSSTAPLKASWFGVKADGVTDDNTAWQRVINYMVGLNVSRCFAPAGVSIITKLTLPSYGHTAAGLKVIEICGVAQPSTLFGTAQIANTLSTSGSILKSTSTGNAILRCIDDGAGGQSLYHIVLRDLTFRSYDNPNISAIDMRYAAQFSAYNLEIDTGVYPTMAGSNPVNAGVYGIQMPLNGNGGISRLQNVIVQGYHIGVGVEEHSSFSDVAVYSCSICLYFNAANHSSRFERVHLANSPYFIYAEPTVVNPIRVDMAQISIEHYNAAIEGASWQTTIADVYDPSNLLKGEMTYEAGLGYVDGTEDPIVITGATKFSCLRIGKQYPLVSLGYLASNQAITTGGGGGAISFTDSKTEGGAAVKSADHTYYTITDTGTFAIDFRGAFAGSAAGTYRRAELYYGGVVVDQAIIAPLGTNQMQMRMRVPAVNNTAATDVRVIVYQDSGGNLNFIGDGTSSGILTVTKLKTQQAT